MKRILLTLLVFFGGCTTPLGVWTFEQKTYNKGWNIYIGDVYSCETNIAYCTVKHVQLNYIQIFRILDLKDGKVIRNDDRLHIFFRETETGWAVDQDEEQDSPLYTETSIDATLKDWPKWSRCNTRWEFQTAAVEVVDDNNVKILGVIKWGFDVDEKGKMRKHLVWMFQSTPELMESIQKWNNQIKENICKNSNNQIEVFIKDYTFDNIGTK